MEERSKVIEDLRLLARDPTKRDEMTVAWNQVCDALHTHYLAMRPKPKSFEVHHMNETARYHFACAVVAGQPMTKCIDAAVTKITG